MRSLVQIAASLAVALVLCFASAARADVADAGALATPPVSIAPPVTSTTTAADAKPTDKTSPTVASDVTDAGAPQTASAAVSAADTDGGSAVPAIASAPDAGVATAPALPGAVAASQAGKSSGVDEAFELKVKSLEENVNELKEKIFRTKARLLLLQETVLGGDITAGAKAILIHRNEMGSQFVLESVSYALDGAPIFTRVDSEGDLDKKQEIEIFNGRIVPGNHAISVKLQYRGHGYGVFSYLEGYKFRVQSSYTFDAEGGKVTQIKIVGYEKGNITTDLKDRPAVKYDVEVIRDTVKRATSDAAEAAPSEARPQ